jgi:putative IMPACT (imprinted ancient) family translation regulator
MQIGATATKQWRTAWETYMQELRASAAGDDEFQRASAAYRNLQREYDKIQADYMKACEERYSRMGSELTAQSASARNKLLDTWIEGLNELRRMTAGSPAAKSTKTGGAE